MKPFLKITLGVIIVITCSLITLGVLLNELKDKSFYDETGTVKVPGLVSRVIVAKDSYGVPHITATSESDLYFALGYMHAQDRLWQMDISRRVAQGRLSEIMGKEVLPYDKLYRTIAIDKMAETLYQKISPKSKELLTRYSEGVNKFIENNWKNLPMEFDVLNYKPEPWTPQNSLMIVRLMGWELNTAWFTDFTFGEIVNKFGLERATEFFPDYPDDAPYIVKGDTTKKSAPQDTSKKISGNYNFFEGKAEDGYRDLSQLGKDFYNTTRDFKKFYGTEGMHVGSNAWVISGSKSESGKPLLANDPHLSLQVPSKWYEVDLFNDNTKRSVTGFSIPGAPAVVIGSNASISWGITNLMNDDTDFYVLDLDGSGNNNYRYNDSVYTLDSTVQGIKVKGEKDEVQYTTYKTALGPVVSGLEKIGFRSKEKFPQQGGKLLTFKWTGYEVSDEVLAFYKINLADNWDEFRNGLKEMGTPATSFVYADVNGNIGYQAAGKIPIRENMQTTYAPLYPSRGEIKWSSYVPFDELPKTYNPKEGYIATANNKPVKDYKYYISNLFEPGYRSERIESVLKSRNAFSPEDFKLLQNDVYSIQAQEFLKYLFDAVKDSSRINPEYEKYLKLLKDWDFQMISSSPAATIYAQFELELYRNLYKQVLGDELFDSYIYIKNIPIKNTARLLKANDSWLLRLSADTAKTSPRDNILIKSFYNAVDALTQRAGGDYNNWLWGDFHKVTIGHPLGSVAALSSILNIGPYNVKGCGTTVSNSEYKLSAALGTGRFDCVLGPSMRMVIDMKDPRILYTINTTGQSGQPMHPNFSDQTRLWLNGDYKIETSDLTKLAQEKLNVLYLDP